MEQGAATIVKDAVEGLSSSIRFTAGEIAVFKEALCTITQQMNKSSDEMLKASVRYFTATIILSAVIALAMIAQVVVLLVKP